MWSFQSLRDTVQSHTSNILRKSNSDGRAQDDYRAHHKDAMQNVVTPQSIPKFIIPTMLNDDSILQYDEEGVELKPQVTRTKSAMFPLSMKSHGKRDNLQVPFLDGNSSSEETTPLYPKKASGSPSSRSLKSFMPRKKSDSRPNSPNPRSEIRIYEPPRESQKTSDSRSRDQLDQPGMSLQHLRATRSGFSTLSESPNTRRKESLFFTPIETTQGLITNKGDKRSHSSGSEENVSSSRSSPRDSPKQLQRRSPFSKSDRRKDGSEWSSAWSDDTSESVDDGVGPSTNGTNCGDRPTICPSIRICIAYLAVHKRLNVSILEGKDFIPRHSVYLKVSLVPRHDRSYRTDPIKIDDTNPKIQERFTFGNIDEGSIPFMSLKICCKEKSSLIRQADVIGEGVIQLCDIDVKTSNDMWMDLKSFEEEEAPHLQLTLCYDAVIGLLTVDVVAARNAPKGRLGRLPDCLVTVTKYIPSQQNSRRQKKTKIIKQTQDPAFNESFLFSLCNEELTSKDLVIAATLMVKDKSKGSFVAVGSAMLGQAVKCPTGRSQWATALKEEGKPVTHWRSLVPSDLGVS